MRQFNIVSTILIISTVSRFSALHAGDLQINNLTEREFMIVIRAIDSGDGVLRELEPTLPYTIKPASFGTLTKRPGVRIQAARIRFMLWSAEGQTDWLIGVNRPREGVLITNSHFLTVDRKQRISERKDGVVYLANRTPLEIRFKLHWYLGSEGGREDEKKYLTETWQDVVVKPNKQQFIPSIYQARSRLSAKAVAFTTETVDGTIIGSGIAYSRLEPKDRRDHYAFRATDGNTVCISVVHNQAVLATKRDRAIVNSFVAAGASVLAEKFERDDSALGSLLATLSRQKRDVVVNKVIGEQFPYLEDNDVEAVTAIVAEVVDGTLKLTREDAGDSHERVVSALVRKGVDVGTASEIANTITPVFVPISTSGERSESPARSSPNEQGMVRVTNQTDHVVELLWEPTPGTSNIRGISSHKWEVNPNSQTVLSFDGLAVRSSTFKYRLRTSIPLDFSGKHGGTTPKGKDAWVDRFDQSKGRFLDIAITNDKIVQLPEQKTGIGKVYIHNKSDSDFRVETISIITKHGQSVNIRCIPAITVSVGQKTLVKSGEKPVSAYYVWCDIITENACADKEARGAEDGELVLAVYNFNLADPLVVPATTRQRHKDLVELIESCYFSPNRYRQRDINEIPSASDEDLRYSWKFYCELFEKHFGKPHTRFLKENNPY